MSDRWSGNLRKWVDETANGEPIEAVVLGEMGWGDYGSEQVPTYATQKRGVILSWDEAAPMIDYTFDSGYGAPGCNALWAWTASRVIFVSTYDGSTNPSWVPRNPTAGEPDMPGG